MILPMISIGLTLIAFYFLTIGQLYGRSAKAYLAATEAYNSGNLTEGERMHAEGDRRRELAERVDLFRVGGR